MREEIDIKRSMDELNLEKKQFATEINKAYNNLISDSLKKELFSIYDSFEENISESMEILSKIRDETGAARYISSGIYSIEHDILLWQKKGMEQVSDILKNRNELFQEKGYGTYDGLEELVKELHQRNNIRTSELVSNEVKLINRILDTHQLKTDAGILTQLDLTIKERNREHYKGTFHSRQSRVNGYVSGHYNEQEMNEVRDRFGIQVENAAMARVVLLGDIRGLSKDVIINCVNKCPGDSFRVNEYMRAAQIYGEIDKDLKYPTECLYTGITLAHQRPELENLLKNHKLSFDNICLIREAVDLEIPTKEILENIKIDKQSGEVDFSFLREQVIELQEEDEIDFEGIAEEKEEQLDYEYMLEENKQHELDKSQEKEDRIKDELYESVLEDGLVGGTAAAAVSMFGQFDVQPVKTSVISNERQSFSDLAAYANSLNNKQKMDRITDMLSDVPNGSDFMIKDNYGCDFIHVQKDVNGNVSIIRAEDECIIDREEFRKMCEKYPEDSYRQVVGRTERYIKTKDRNERYEPTRERILRQDN